MRNTSILIKSNIAAVEFDRKSALANIERITAQATIFEVSATKGQGMECSYTYPQTKISQPLTVKLS